ncbi:MAG: DUF1016 N-terminal domain-containing protein [Oscillospiraceae bacterium]|nr:DUF1016 N-terminal domain-containing protein [Oscillospiraceae bacterium]
MDENKLNMTQKSDEIDFYMHVADLLAAMRKYAKQQLDRTIVLTYYEIGRMIIEREQLGQKRAQYGAKLLKGLSEYLTDQYGRGFSIANLKNIRKFYQIYAFSKGQSLISLFEKNNSLINNFDANEQKWQTLASQFNKIKTKGTAFDLNFLSIFTAIVVQL